ncbi:SDR family oxidoreductase [Legionella anisa]|uniref:SDR family oxidoreductase n=1 Tax=Legionella anisa TaxID=28082 RepID=A0AAX0WQ90_9GAMM|nr:SDR family oxidoreductase [Legionella anisa]AWN73157.1 SDR family NAD(P)-dependent oxidoreductase [Legionella anisa]KTC67407.1 short chain dehydrogenase [Legionella anisa]MBN5936127.1 SDR family oxidoreductase [Legionella anisa]MCW8423988.1 SDR family oxidoreductase [Legionella anisa]MCW8447510.1 SDR family oxidoreductase [Legionella anisa]
MITLITGASRGIGHALAFEFARHGHDLILTARNQSLLEELAIQIKEKYSVNVTVIALDLSEPKAAAALVHQIEALNIEIDCLVNNAGIGYLGDFVSMDAEYLNALMQLNMTTLTMLTYYFAKKFVHKGQGKILQVASTAAFQPGPFMAAYYASKSYVASFSEALAYELKGTGVSLSILCPGPTQSDFFKEAGMENSFLARGFIGIKSTEQIAKAAYQGVKKNKLFIIPGSMSKILAYSAKFTPDALSLRITSFLHRRNQANTK